MSLIAEFVMHYLHQKLIYFSIVGCSAFFVRVKIYSLTSEDEDCVNIFNFGILSMMIAISCTFLTQCLKLEYQMDISWNGCFWAFWVFFAVCAGLNFAFFLIFANRLFVKIFEGGVKNEESINVITSRWFVLDLLYSHFHFSVLLYVYHFRNPNFTRSEVLIDAVHTLHNAFTPLYLLFFLHLFKKHTYFLLFPHNPGWKKRRD